MDRTGCILAVVVLALLGVGLVVAVTCLPGRTSFRRDNERALERLHEDAARHWNERVPDPAPR